MSAPAEAVGVVVIGRNEGARLEACLRALPSPADIVYVDSGSSDGSVAFARRLGAEVIELPPGLPFTAARARNAGLAAIRARPTPPAYVQMIDGDCTLDARWLEHATAALAAEPALAVVFGRRRERFPERSVYNRLCDAEWDVPVGYANACGGDALFRLAPLAAAGGYDPTLIAGEEPDLCLRLRAAGWRVRRIDAEMTLHDAAMTRFGQWWRRTKRAGHAFAEHVWRHRARSDPAWVREVQRIAAWGGLLPLLILLLLLTTLRWPALAIVAGGLALLYPLQVARIARRLQREGRPAGFARAMAGFLTLGKLPQMLGMLQFATSRLAGRAPALIEYKGPEAVG